MLRATWTFAVAAVLTTVFGLLVLTLGLLLPVKWCFQPAFRLWSCGILWAAGVRYVVEGAEHLDFEQFSFYVGNHQSALDIPLMAVVTRGTVRFLAKKSLFKIPILGWAMWAYGFLPVDRSSARRTKSSLDAMLHRLASPVSMLVFPEGTRTEDGSVLPFKRGSMQVCERAGMPIVPFTLDGTLQVHKRRIFRVRPGCVRVAFGEPIQPEQAGHMSAKDLSSQVRATVLQMLNRSDDSDPTRLSAVAASQGGRA